MKQIKQTYEIKAPIDEVWQAFFNPSSIEKWSGVPGEMSEEEGGEFSLWDGDIHGTNTKVIKHRVLEQDWYGHSGDHPERCYKVTFTFSSSGGVTTINLLHSDIPDDEVEDFEDGWRTYYLGPIKRLLEK